MTNLVGWIIAIAQSQAGTPGYGRDDDIATSAQPIFRVEIPAGGYEVGPGAHRGKWDEISPISRVIPP